MEEGTEEEQEVEAQAEPQAPEMGASEDDQGIGARVTAVFTAAEKAGQHIVTLAREEADDILRQARAEADAYLREQKLQADKEVEQIFADARRKAEARFGDPSRVRDELRPLAESIDRRRRIGEYLAEFRQDLAFALRFGEREGEALQRGALLGQAGAEVLNPQFGHLSPTTKRSYSFSDGTPQHAQNSPVAGRITAAPQDS